MGREGEEEEVEEEDMECMERECREERGVAEDGGLGGRAEEADMSEKEQLGDTRSGALYVAVL